MIGTSGYTNGLSRLYREDFTKKIDGKQTDLFLLKNKNGMEIAVTNFGAIVLSIMVPDRHGNYANVILGHDHINNVINSPEPFLNSVIGRYGNRIAKGKFTLDGKEYSLAINNGPNSLHGGPQGFHRAIWETETAGNQRLILKYTSRDGEEEFPGTLAVTLTYTLTDENEFVIDYKAVTDKKTIVNLTHHGFYNLAGITDPTPSVESHIVTILSDFYLPIDEVSIPTGEILSVEGTPMDFRTPHTIGKYIDDNFSQLVYGNGYDHCYVLNKKEPKELTRAVKYTDPASGRSMEVYTTEPGIQLYTGNWLNGFQGAHGATFPARSAVCFEAQHFPDTPNHPYFPTVELNPSEEYTQTTIYKFGVEE